MIAASLGSVSAPVLAQSSGTGASGLPIPRYVSIKSDRVNVRVGPSRDHDIAWSFVKSRVPVEIIQEFENWRRIRDWEGNTGWVFRTLLSGYRSALVTPWAEKSETTPLRASPGPNERIIAYMEPLVLAGVLECEDGYCRISGKDFEGWVDQTRLFGVYPDEDL
ncbi:MULTISPECIES: SH3 domain-containing protein [Pseudovibrio]|uniref:SH3 domain-containing protein n=1 Tax=Stappiaceae TaxID=2821832 RepID=UPI0023673A53|nr:MULTISPECIES: SH3 domain-containing protein [Pseudovibrio]MDD7909534.1 SH3 domain-containing protein [Pseudovibrio exalbescens]MDX5595113.1 SH3 domain-containing protein [Pseudovibrio sp. SPO723]